MHSAFAQKPDLFTHRRLCDHKQAAISIATGTFWPRSAAAPTVRFVGNHDGGRWSDLRYGFKTSARIRELLCGRRNSRAAERRHGTEIKGQRLHVIGLADFWTREFDSHKAFDGLPKQSEQLRVVLSHNPDTKAVLQYYSWELLLCGHTHGGQVQIPFIGSADSADLSIAPITRGCTNGKDAASTSRAGGRGLRRDPVQLPAGSDDSRSGRRFAGGTHGIAAANPPDAVRTPAWIRGQKRGGRPPSLPFAR